jgi:aminoglycoside phosphotransferase
MDKVVKELKGHSGSKVYLMENDDRLFIRKVGNIERNIERLSHLAENYPVPKIYQIEPHFDMEYFHGIDMKTYLRANTINELANFIISLLKKFASNSIDKDYTETYYQKLKWMDDNTELPFGKEEFISKLPKVLPQSNYHGDLTLENILKTKDRFCLIDAVTIEYDSYIFDVAKLRQDLECKWFLRNNRIKLDVKLQNLQDMILKRFDLANNDYILILMLLRVYLHTEPNDSNRKFILKEINRLWK